jgi:hypothetical protein
MVYFVSSTNMPGHIIFDLFGRDDRTLADRQIYLMHQNPIGAT